MRSKIGGFKDFAAVFSFVHFHFLNLSKTMNVCSKTLDKQCIYEKIYIYIHIYIYIYIYILRFTIFEIIFLFLSETRILKE